MPEKGLSDVRVLDLTWYIAGPYCTKLLADRGAEVIKVERPGQGDPARHIGPFLHDEPHPERCALFLYLNNNKKSLTLNLKSQAGVEIIRELVKQADVLVESFSPGVMERLGLDYAAMEKINPKLVMTSISNFGETGPYRDYQSTHLVNCALSSWMFSTGDPDKQPLQVGGWVSHYIAGIHGAIGTMCALHWARETGEGQHVDLSAHEAMISTSRSLQLLWHSYGGRYRRREGNVQVGSTGQVCPTRDGYIAVNILNQIHWDAFTQYMQRPELENPKFATPLLRRDNIKELTDLVFNMFREREHDEVFHSGQAWRVPFGLVPSAGEVLQSDQYKAREYFVEMEHPVVGKVIIPGASCKMSDSSFEIRSAAPLLGEHNEEILASLGYSKEEIARLRQNGVI